MKLKLKSQEIEMYNVIKQYHEKKITKEQASVMLGVTTKTIENRYKRFLNEGISSFQHKNRGRSPQNKISKEDEQRIVDLYINHYQQFNTNFAQFMEFVETDLGVKIKSRQTMRNILMRNGILSPLAKKKTKRRCKQNKNIITIDGNDIELFDDNYFLENNLVHPSKPRAPRFGELVLMDTGFIKFNDDHLAIHLAIDDSTSKCIGAYIDTQETTYGYYQVMFQILTTYGAPYSILTDNRSTFAINSKKKKTIDDDFLTNFGICCQHYGIDLNTTSIPQRKGRVERLVQTIKGRLPAELYRAQATTYDEYNKVLQKLVSHYNEMFALDEEKITSVFDPVNVDKIEYHLAWHYPRKLSNGQTIHFNNKVYRLMANENTINLVPGRKGFVIKTFKNKLYFFTCNMFFRLEALPQHMKYTKRYDGQNVYLSKYPQPDSHPWKGASYNRTLKKVITKQQHLDNNLKKDILKF